MEGFISAMLAKVTNCQYGTFEPLHGIQKFVLPKAILFKQYETGNNEKENQKISQSQANPWLRSAKVQKF